MKKKVFVRIAEHQQHAVITLLFCQQYPIRERETKQTTQANAKAMFVKDKRQLFNSV